MISKNLLPIILVNFNNTHDTEECIESIYKSEGVQPFVIVVDNASENKKELNILKEKDMKKLLRNILKNIMLLKVMVKIQEFIVIVKGGLKLMRLFIYTL